MEKLETRLCRLVGQAVADYHMIEDRDRLMVCLSGGKDSYGMLEILLSLRSRAPIHFELIAVNLDQKQPGFPAHVLPDYLTRRGVPFHIETRDTYSVVKRLIPPGQTTCSLCSRLRRGHLYRIGTELNATKIALGHHRDDILETLLLNLFFYGQTEGHATEASLKERSPCGDSAIGLCEGSGPGTVCVSATISNHSLRLMRFAGEFETKTSQDATWRMESAISRFQGQHVCGPFQRLSITVVGPPIIRLRGPSRRRRVGRNRGG